MLDFYCENKKGCDQSPLCPNCGVNSARRRDYFAKLNKKASSGKPGRGTKDAPEKEKTESIAEIL